MLAVRTLKICKNSAGWSSKSHNIQIFKERRKRAKILESYAEYEEERLCVTQSKKYEVLVGRLEEYRRDK